MSDLKVKTKSIKLLEENRSIKLCGCQRLARTRGWGEGLVTANDYGVSFGVKIFWNVIVVMVIQLCEDIKNH